VSRLCPGADLRFFAAQFDHLAQVSAKPCQSFAGRWLRQACSQRLPASDLASTRLSGSSAA
jgi:hypothetical protein